MKKVKVSVETFLVSLEFVSRETLNLALGRVSHFRESKSNKGEIKDAVKPYDGHNFPLDALLSFEKTVKSAPKAKGLRLLREEEELIALLKENKVYSKEFYLVGFLKGDVKTKKHEGLHGKFYLDNKYRNEMTQIWNSLPAKQRNYLNEFLSKLGYDESVHIDEFQAYHFTEPTNFWGIKLDL